MTQQSAPLSERRERIGIPRPSGVRFLISGDTLAQHFEWARTNLRKPRQFQLEKHRVDVFLCRADKAMQNNPCNPAARIVLDAQQALQELLVQQSVVVARQSG